MLMKPYSFHYLTSENGNAIYPHNSEGGNKNTNQNNINIIIQHLSETCVLDLINLLAYFDPINPYTPSVT